MKGLEDAARLLASPDRRLDLSLKRFFLGPESEFAILVRDCFDNNNDDSLTNLERLVDSILEPASEPAEYLRLLASNNPIRWSLLPSSDEASKSELAEIERRDAELWNQQQTLLQADTMLRNLRIVIRFLRTRATGLSHAISPNELIEGDPSKQTPPVGWPLDAFDAVARRLNDSVPEIPSTKIPLLLVTPRDYAPNASLRGLVVDLDVTPIRAPIGNTGPFLKLGDLGFSGLTMDRSPDQKRGFASGVLRAWSACRFEKESEPTMRWTMKRRKTDEVYVERFDDRSCEAAFACAFLSAYAAVQPERATQEALDTNATVTAMLEDDPAWPNMTPLRPIRGLTEKVIAADRSDIDLIVVAEGQLDQCFDTDVSDGQRIDQLRATGRIGDLEIVEADTLQRAYEHLTSTGRLMRELNRRNKWIFRSQWLSDTGRSQRHDDEDWEDLERDFGPDKSSEKI